MTKTIRLTMAQALIRFLASQKTEIDGETLPLFGGVWAIFGHGNVAAVGEALYRHRDELPTFRAHNEQAMAHAAIAYAKANFRRRMMAATTSIRPGSRYFDRITRPEQIVPALNRAMGVLTDPAECGPVTLSLCQDVQAEAYDYPTAMFEERVWIPRRPQPDAHELDAAVAAIRASQKPVIIAGGGVLYSEAAEGLRAFAERHGVPVMETQGGKSTLPHVHPLNMGSVGVTGSSASNLLAEQADLVLAVGSRLQDFTTGSWALFKADGVKIIGLNTQVFDAGKHRAMTLIADAKVGLDLLDGRLGPWHASDAWQATAKAAKTDWLS